MKTEPRREQILNLLEEIGTLNVGDLADRFAVSVVTIRKDLDELESEGLLQRTFGGAVFSHRSRFNRSFFERVQIHRQEKRAIAAAALEYIKDGDTIILDAGTTTLALAQLLKEQVKSAFIITCSVPVALELSSAGYDILLWVASLEIRAWPYWAGKHRQSWTVIAPTRRSLAVPALRLRKGAAQLIQTMHRSKRQLCAFPTRPTCW